MLSEQRIQKINPRKIYTEKKREQQQKSNIQAVTIQQKRDQECDCRIHGFPFSNIDTSNHMQNQMLGNDNNKKTTYS